MALSVVDLYQKILPKTNCGDCGYSTCLAFASMVVSEKLPLEGCPHVDPETLAACNRELEEQYAANKWTKRDMGKDALAWAKERAASMEIADLPARIGGERIDQGGPAVRLPYFTGHVLIRPGRIELPDGSEANQWEQVFLYNHMAQGGSREPVGEWKALEQIPNTVSKIKSMREHVEAPLIEAFTGRAADFRAAAMALGGTDAAADHPTADAAVRLQPLPKVPVLALFWDAEPDDGFGAQAKLLFDETITEHLDIESILFLSERIRQLLIGEEG